MTVDGLGPTSTAVVVGAALAGLRAAEAIRAEGFTGRLVLVGTEPRLPYDRPPLSKQYLAGEWDEARIALVRDDDAFARLGLDLMLGRTATALDAEAGRLELDDGTGLDFDGLVVATGARPRVLPGTDGVPGVCTLRTLDDAVALRRAVVPGARVVVVGAGFIGSEVAATAASLGAAVTVVEPLPVPLARALGVRVGAACASLHEANGVALRLGVGVASVVASPSPSASGAPLEVALDDGTTLAADVVVVGIGVVPATEWLAGSGLTVSDGVVADGALFAADAVTVAGDLARWRDARLGEEVRIEHWTNAAESGQAAGRNLVAGRRAAPAYSPIPYVWSDQHGRKIQVLGWPRPDDEVAVVDGSVEEHRFVAVYGRAGRLTAAVGFSRPRQLMGFRALLEAGAGFDDALAHLG